METLARILRILTKCTTIEDADYLFTKTRKQYVKIQKRMIKEQRESKAILEAAKKAMEQQERVQRQAEKRIAKINDILED